MLLRPLYSFYDTTETFSWKTTLTGFFPISIPLEIVSRMRCCSISICFSANDLLLFSLIKRGLGKLELLGMVTLFCGIFLFTVGGFHRRCSDLAELSLPFQFMRKVFPFQKNPTRKGSLKQKKGPQPIRNQKQLREFV